MARKHFENVDEYISDFPEEMQTILKKVRATIKEMVPEATEMISYQIPAYKLDGKYLIYFAGFKKHISFYPVHPDDKHFDKDLTPFVNGRGTIKFDLSEPLPWDKIKKVVNYKLKALQEAE